MIKLNVVIRGIKVANQLTLQQGECLRLFMLSQCHQQAPKKWHWTPEDNMPERWWRRTSPAGVGLEYEEESGTKQSGQPVEGKKGKRLSMNQGRWVVSGS